ncbi:hypothetical protein SAMN06295900_11274 [Trinickia caryophylli]|uniref:Uncharacterized protein n=1 Tax=Trinickia caryophylli TaxID=28094 RepID=A0A1X7FWM9_TRICW|nr:hypothetical protein SAMN06295900_11274 [Trinickia caryophylli]
MNTRPFPFPVPLTGGGHVAVPSVAQARGSHWRGVLRMALRRWNALVAAGRP